MRDRVRCACCTQLVDYRDAHPRETGGVLCHDCWSNLQDDMDYSGSASKDDDNRNSKKDD